MNMGFNGYGSFGEALSRPDPVKIMNAAYETLIKKFSDALPNPRGYYFRDGFQKDVAKAEATRNKEILPKRLEIKKYYLQLNSIVVFLLVAEAKLVSITIETTRL